MDLFPEKIQFINKRKSRHHVFLSSHDLLRRYDDFLKMNDGKWLTNYLKVVKHMFATDSILPIAPVTEWTLSFLFEEESRSGSLLRSIFGPAGGGRFFNIRLEINILIDISEDVVRCIKMKLLPPE